MKKSQHLTKRKLNTCLGEALRAARQATNQTQREFGLKILRDYGVVP